MNTDRFVLLSNLRTVCRRGLRLSVAAVGLCVVEIAFGHSAIAQVVRAPLPAMAIELRHSAARLPDGALLEVGRAAQPLLTQLAEPRPISLTGLPDAERAGASITVLPEGRVLVFGGVRSDGRLLTQAYWFDIASKTFKAATEELPTARAQHIALVLTDGRVLIAGGVDARLNLIEGVQLWDPRSGIITPLGRDPLIDRIGAQATLLADGNVLIEGGQNRSGQPVRAAVLRTDVWQPTSISDAEATRLRSGATTFAVAATLPPEASTSAAPDQLIALRFSRPADIPTVNAQTITLFGPGGVQDAKVIPSQDGMLAFITPLRPLLPGASYSVFVRGVRSQQTEQIAFFASGFQTAALGFASAPTVSMPGGAPSPEGMSQPGATSSPAEASTERDDDDVFEIHELARKGHWRTARPLTSDVRERFKHEHERWLAKREEAPAELKSRVRTLRSGSLAQAAAATASTSNTGAVEGRVLRLNDRPLADVTVTIGTRSTRTDADGSFELEGIAPGRHEMVVDGSSAGRGGREYAQFVIGVEVEADTVTRLPYTIFVPRIRPKDWVRINAPVQRDTTVTHPDMPGLEIQIPRGAVLLDRAGKPLTRIAIVPVPLDRAPFPVPDDFPVYFSVQPGGLIVQGLDPQSARGIRVIYPNYSNAAPGTRAIFSDYDPKDRDWFAYGSGRVSDDGKQIIPDPGVAFYKAMGSSVSFPPVPPPPPCPAGTCCAGDGDPVACETGTFTHSVTDLTLGDVVPLTVTRSYRTKDATARLFGKGMSSDYSAFITSGDPLNQFTYMLVAWGDGSQVRFNRISGTGAYLTSVFEGNEAPGRFFKAIMQYSLAVGMMEVKTRTGEIYRFQTGAGGGYLREQLDRFGNSTKITRTGSQIQRITSPSGRYVDFIYTGANPTEVKDFTGRRIQYLYDANSFLTKITYPDNTTEEYTYNASGNMLTVKDRRTNTMVTNEYDANQRVIKQTLADGAIYQFAYTLDTNGNVTRTDVTRPRTLVRRIDFDAKGYITQETHAFGTAQAQTWTYARQAGTNFLMSVTDPLGRRTDYTYDSRGNRLTRTQLAGTPNAVTETWTYSSTFNDVITAKNGLNHTSTFTYDSLGRLTSFKNPLNETTSFTYNSAGQAVSIKDPRNKITTLTYDLYDLRSVSDPLSRITTAQADALGRTTVLVDSLGHRTYIEYDAIDRQVKVTDAQGRITNMAYDGAGNLTGVTDARNNSRTFTYDTRHRVATARDALLRTNSYVYDHAGNLTRFTDRKGQITNFTYDNQNRRTQATYYNGTKTQWTYDAGNRVTQIQELSATSVVLSTITRSWDGLNRLTQEVTPQGTISYAYDKGHRRTAQTVTGQPSLAYTYDNASRLTQIQQGGGRTITYGYDVASRLTTSTLANGIVATHTYDDANQLTAISYANGGTTVGNITYSYDANGRRISQGGTLHEAFLPQATTADAIFDANNKLTQQDGINYTYDNNGSLTSDGIRTYTWDVRNRLIEIKQGATAIASFSHDAVGRRNDKTVSGATTRYLYDGINAVQELSGTNNPLANIVTTGLDQGAWRTEGANTKHFLTDALGSTRALADDGKAISTRYQYEPYGETTTSGAASTNPSQYTGRENDGTGLYYYRARYYHPRLKRFISEDPIGMHGGINVYQYVHGDPISLRDPLGLAPICSSWSKINESNYSANVYEYEELLLLEYLSYVPAGVKLGEDLPDTPRGGKRPKPRVPIGPELVFDVWLNGLFWVTTSTYLADFYKSTMQRSCSETNFEQTCDGGTKSINGTPNYETQDFKHELGRTLVSKVSGWEDRRLRYAGRSSFP